MVCLGSPHRNAVPIHYQWLLFFIFLPLFISTQCMAKSSHAPLLGGLLKQRLFHKTVYLQSVLSIDTRQSSSLHLIALQLTAGCCPYARPPTPPSASIGDRGKGWVGRTPGAALVPVLLVPLHLGTSAYSQLSEELGFFSVGNIRHNLPDTQIWNFNKSPPKPERAPGFPPELF